VTFRAGFLNVSFFKVFKNVVVIVNTKIVENYWQKVFVVFAFLGLELKVTIVARREKILTCNVTVMLDLIVLMREGAVTIEACVWLPDVSSSRHRTWEKGGPDGKEFRRLLRFRTLYARKSES